MAQIPVEKKSSMAWLWILLALLLIGALLWWLFAEADDNDVDAYDADETVAAGQLDDADTGNIDTDLDMDAGDMDAAGATVGDAGAATATGIAALAVLGDRIGDTIDFDTVRVNRVVGDAAFTVGTGANETLVMFDEVPTPGTAVEGRFDINPGNTVTFEGEARRIDRSALPASVRADIDASEEFYLFADNLKKIR